MIVGTPMKFTTFHQHNQHVAHPQYTQNNATNGNFNGSNFQTQMINIPNQQHFLMPQQIHHHHQQSQQQQQQQFFDNNIQLPGNVNFPSNSNYSRLPMNIQSQQQRTSPYWRQSYSNQMIPHMRNDFNGNNESG